MQRLQSEAAAERAGHLLQVYQGVRSLQQQHCKVSQVSSISGFNNVLSSSKAKGAGATCSDCIFNECSSRCNDIGVDEDVGIQDLLHGLTQLN